MQIKLPTFLTFAQHRSGQLHIMATPYCKFQSARLLGRLNVTLNTELEECLYGIQPWLSIQYTITLRTTFVESPKKTKKKLHGLSPRANYTDRVAAACRRSGCQRSRIEGATWSA
jgi:hypothetical protein